MFAVSRQTTFKTSCRVFAQKLFYNFKPCLVFLRPAYELPVHKTDMLEKRKPSKTLMRELNFLYLPCNRSYRKEFLILLCQSFLAHVITFTNPL